MLCVQYSKARWVWLTDESPAYTNLFGGILKPGSSSKRQINHKELSARCFQLVYDLSLKQ